MEQSLAEMICILKINTECEGCKAKVMQVLRNIRGVYNVTIDGEEGKVKVTGRVNPTTLLSVLEKYGNHAKVKYIKFDGEVMERRDPYYYGEANGYVPYGGDGTMEYSSYPSLPPHPQPQSYHHQPYVPPPPLPLPPQPLLPPPQPCHLPLAPSFVPPFLPPAPTWPPPTRPYGPPPLAPDWPPPPNAPRPEIPDRNRTKDCVVM